MEAEQESQRPSLSSEFEDQSAGNGKEETKIGGSENEGDVLDTGGSESKVEEKSEEIKDEAESTEDKVSVLASLPDPDHSARD